MRGKPWCVTERHETDRGISKAWFSPCHNYRYALTRRWGSGPTACWIMLNPSTADAFREDNTSRRVTTFTRRLGSFGAFTIVNLYSLRSTKPDALWHHPEPIGPLGEQFLNSQATTRSFVIAAWGAHGARDGRGNQVAAMLADVGVTLHCLGVTNNGQPRHPLYVPGDTAFQTYRVREVTGV